MHNKITDISPPIDVDLSKNQQKLFTNYKRSYQNLTKDPKNRNIINICLNSLVVFYKSLESNAQKKFNIWYQYQLTFIDPTLVASSKIANIASKAGIPESLAVDESGHKFYIRTNKTNLNKLKQIITQELPSLQYKIAE